MLLTFALNFRGDVVRRPHSRVRQLPISFVMVARICYGFLLGGYCTVLWLFDSRLIELFGPQFGMLAESKVG